MHNSQSSTNRKHKTHPCEVSLLWDHNYTIQPAKAFSFRPLSDETIMKMSYYFIQGHSPASALHLHNLNLPIQFNNTDGELEKARVDHSLNPLYTDTYYLYIKWRKKNHGAASGKQMFQKLEEMAKEYNVNHGNEGGSAFLQQYERNIKGNTHKLSTTSVCDSDTPLIIISCMYSFDGTCTQIITAGW